LGVPIFSTKATSNQGYVCRLRLSPSSLCSNSTSAEFPAPFQAKRDVAQKACQILVKAGELDTELRTLRIGQLNPLPMNLRDRMISIAERDSLGL
ncbi:hypothetical protein BGX26_003799, partial [Mortierella sp. AD094]